MSEWNVIHENFHTKHSVLTAPDEHMPYIIQLHIMSIQWERERDRQTERQTEKTRLSVTPGHRTVQEGLSMVPCRESITKSKHVLDWKLFTPNFCPWGLRQNPVSGISTWHHTKSFLHGAVRRSHREPCFSIYIYIYVTECIVYMFGAMTL